MPSDRLPPLYLVDGSGYIFRAFHAMPPLNRPDGTPVNAVLGFTNMLLKLLEDRKADAVAVIFDAARRNYRNDIYADYKANRADPPLELVPQFALIREATEAFNVPALELEGYEADDLIATYARLARAQGRTVTIVSSDKDLMQLVRDGVGMLDPIKNKPIGSEAVVEKFGVPPDKVVDVQALAGDSIDNVPGVPGIGIKTAAQLIESYGDLETLLARVGEIKQPKRRQTLTEHAENARISKRLVQLDDQVPVPVSLDDLGVRDQDRDKLLAFLRTQGFHSVITRLEQTWRQEDWTTLAPHRVAPATAPSPSSTDTADLSALPDTSAPPAALEEVHYELVQDEAALERWIADAQETGVLAVDTETDSLVPSRAKLVGVCLSVTSGRACYIPVGHVVDGLLAGSAEPLRQLPLETVVRRLKPVLEDPSVLKVGHNMKYDAQVLAQHGITVAPVDDTMLMSYVLDGGAHGHGMDELAQIHLAHTAIAYDEVTGKGKARITFDRVPLDRACQYAAEDADITLRLHQLLKPRLVPARAVTLYETIERPLVPVVAEMERTGIRVDPAVLSRLSREFAERLEELEGEVQKLAGRPFNVGSPKQLGEVLFDDMGLPGGKRGKAGAYSTDSSVLEPLADQGIEIAARVLDWRQLSKLKSTYTDTLQEDINPRTGRVHTSFAMAHTNTGRMASSDPNLQNIPIRTEEGRKIRTAFVTDPGWSLLSVDYSQIELRLVAEIAGVAALKQAFHDGIDIHALTASQVFGIPLETMTGELRRQAKAINFGIIYGISGFGLGRQLGIPPGAANAFIKDYLQRFHELRDWMAATKEMCRKTGHVTTLFGRRCVIPGIADRNPARRGFAERQAINAPIQGTAADIIKRAMVRVPSALAKAGLGARMLLQVHDELLFEVPDAERDDTAALVRQVMEGAATLGVPLVAEAGFGANWAEAH